MLLFPGSSWWLPAWWLLRLLGGVRGNCAATAAGGVKGGGCAATADTRGSDICSPNGCRGCCSGGVCANGGCCGV